MLCFPYTLLIPTQIFKNFTFVHQVIILLKHFFFCINCDIKMIKNLCVLLFNVYIDLTFYNCSQFRIFNTKNVINTKQNFCENIRQLDS